MGAPTRMAVSQIVGCSIAEASDIDPLGELDLTDEQRAALAEAADAEYRYAATSILEPYGRTLQADGEIVQDNPDDETYPWDEEAIREEFRSIRLPWTLALARAVSAQNVLRGAEARRNEAIILAAKTGVGLSRIAEAMGVEEATVSRIVSEELR